MRFPVDFLAPKSGLDEHKAGGDYIAQAKMTDRIYDEPFGCIRILHKDRIGNVTAIIPTKGYSTEIQRARLLKSIITLQSEYGGEVPEQDRDDGQGRMLRLLFTGDNAQKVETGFFTLEEKLAAELAQARGHGGRT
jgi:hypothetical protein